MKDSFRIADILPFWRWAVCPEGDHSPGIPYWGEAAARAFFNEAKEALPWAGCYLLRRRLFRRGVEVVEHFVPSPIDNP